MATGDMWFIRAPEPSDEDISRLVSEGHTYAEACAILRVSGLAREAAQLSAAQMPDEDREMVKRAHEQELAMRAAGASEEEIQAMYDELIERRQ